MSVAMIENTTCMMDLTAFHWILSLLHFSGSRRSRHSKADCLGEGEGDGDPGGGGEVEVEEV